MKGSKRTRRVNSCEPCGMEDWETQADLEAVCRAAAVNKDPARLEKVKKLAKTKLDDSKTRRDQAQALVDMGEGKNP